MSSWLKRIGVLLALTILLVPAARANASQPLTLDIDGGKIPVSPIIHQGSVYLPLRSAMEHLAAKVTLSGKMILIQRGETNVMLTPGQNSVSINGETISILTPPIVVKNSTYVPLRLVANAFGYEVVYQPSANRVLLRTPGNQAVVYGIVRNVEGEVIQQGSVELLDVESGTPYLAPIRNGFYRITAAPNTYRFSGYREGNSVNIQKVEQQHAFTLNAGQTAFHKLSPSQSGLKITLRDEAGLPIAKATAAFNTSHGRVDVKIHGGVGYLDFMEQGTFTFDELSSADGSLTDLDIFHPFTIDEDGVVSSLDIVAHTPNIIGQISEETPGVYGNLSYCSTREPAHCHVEGAPNGHYAFYLPDGEYLWSSYYDSSIRQHFKVDRTVLVNGEKLQSDMQWTKPQINIHGTASTNEDGPLSGGYIGFYGKGQEFSAWVENGQFNCYVPDGVYTVRYEQFFGGYSSIELDNKVTVTNGKLDIPTNLIFFIS
ncbi:copper amine oxidase N-terminal domain-containing protein [Paenibacillus methanolicus]|uniref:Copper amine oxidase-like protein n=1 Tax=Paenibacillus methanolicus TaxID=582686 RepID=A0A5S5BXK0_9BACL|nr:copper amine oxidase N-terminal domain-containing protein [Paenibacillus methanolicus]TYP71891.1 copper amine oxidase-like protein [Paenibacillus methanolicus]